MDYVRLRGYPIERMLIGNRFMNTLKKDFQTMNWSLLDFSTTQKQKQKNFIL